MEAERLVVDSYEARPAVQVLRASGELDLATVAVLRAGAHVALAQEPNLLVIDLSGVVLSHPPATRVLSQIAAEASVWPVTRVAVAGAASEIRRASGSSTGLVPLTWSDRGPAEAVGLETPAVVRRSLPLDLSAVAMARQAVAAMCADELIRERAEIVVTELVGNALQHARGPIELRAAFIGRVHISVRDGRPDLPPAEAGYGLDVVRWFAAVWGWGPVAGGKVVWAVIGPAPRGRHSVRLTCAS